jgi:CelD/BcsL family acetyltransferase involved in cellulose biosynthesis
MRELAVHIVEDEEEFASLENAWWDLWRRTPSATPFQSPAWLLPWWTAFRPGQLFAITCMHAQRLVGFAPFYLQDGGPGRRILPIGISLSDYLDVLVDPEWQAPVRGAFVNEMARQRPRWDEWNFEELRPEAAALELFCPEGCYAASDQQSACPVLPLVAGEALKHVPSRKRRKLQMSRNRLSRYRAEIFEPLNSRSREFLRDLFRLHTARWQGRGEDGVFADQPVRAFHEASAPKLLAAGVLRLYGILIGSRLIGAYYGFVHRNAAFAYLTGFNPAFAFGSPGTALVGHAIEEACREGACEFHFLRGREDYKYTWGASDRWNMRRTFRTANSSRA